MCLFNVLSVLILHIEGGGITGLIILFNLCVLELAPPLSGYNLAVVFADSKGTHRHTGWWMNKHMCTCMHAHASV